MRIKVWVCSAVLISLMFASLFASPARATVSASPSAVNFGSVNVNSLSSPTVIVFTNTGTDAVFLQQASSSLTQFILAGPALPLVLAAQQSISFQVIFQPTAATAFSGGITFTMVRRSAGTMIVPVTGTGVAVPVNPASSLSPNATTQNFGNRTVGSASFKNIKLTNTGTTTLNISQMTVAGPGYTATGITAPTTLLAGQNVTVRVGYSPTVMEASTGSATVVSDAVNSPAMISISGTGVQALIAVVPTSVSFGNVSVGVTNTQSVTVRNPGTATLTISQATVSGSGFTVSGITLPLTLAAGASSAFTVSYAPTSSGNTTGALTLTSNAPASPLSAALSGSGIAQVRTLSSNPTALNFGSLNQNTSASQSVILTNTGNASVTISQLNIAGAGFSDSGISLPITLAAGQSTSFNAIFDPTTSGNLSGSATVVSNATNSPMSIAFSGSGITPSIHSIDLSWTASTSTVVGYNVFSASQTGGPYTRINSCPMSVTNFSSANAVSGQSYFFVTTAVDASGAESANSNEAITIIP
jgi:hypothetical protein